MRRTIVSVVAGAVLASAITTSGMASAGTGGGKPVITIGTAGTYSSQGILTEEQLAAAKAAVKAVNAEGDIKLKLVSCDDKLDENEAAACGRTLADNADVVAIVGDTSTFGADFAAFQEAGLASIGAYPANAQTYTSPVSFPINSGIFGAFAGTGVVVVEEGYKKPAIIHTDHPQVSTATAAIESVLNKNGIESTTSVPIAEGTADVTPAVTKAIDSGADSIILVLANPLLSQVIQAIYQSGKDLPVVTGASQLSAEDLDTLGPATDTLKGVGVFPSPTGKDAPALKQFHKELKKYAKGTEQNDISLNAWAGVHLFADLVSGMDVVDRPSVLAAMNALSDYDSGGITPNLNFTVPPSQPGALPRMFNTTIALVDIKNGKWVTTKKNVEFLG